MSAPGAELGHYREQLVSRGIAGVLASIGFALAGAGLVIGIAAGIAGGWAAAALGLPLFGLGAFLAGCGMVFSMSQVIVAGRWIQVHFGLTRRAIPVDGIQAVRVVESPSTPHGKVEVGYGGITRTRVGRAASRRAVEIAYYDRGRAHVMVIGSEDPDRFAFAIEEARRAAGSTRPPTYATAR